MAATLVVNMFTLDLVNRLRPWRRSIWLSGDHGVWGALAVVCFAITFASPASESSPTQMQRLLVAARSFRSVSQRTVDRAVHVGRADLHSTRTPRRDDAVLFHALRETARIRSGGFSPFRTVQRRRNGVRHDRRLSGRAARRTIWKAKLDAGQPVSVVAVMALFATVAARCAWLAYSRCKFSCNWRLDRRFRCCGR